MGNLATPKSVQKLQTALHAKAKAEAGYRFYALYDKLSRDDILAHAYAQCRSNKGAPGGDGQDFADIEAYGVERWLGELALALRQETYRPEPIRRVCLLPRPTASSGRWASRPCGTRVLHDSSDAGAWSRSLKPTSHRKSTPIAPGETPSRRSRGGGRAYCSVATRDVVDADLRGLLREHSAYRPPKVGSRAGSLIGACCI